MSVHHCPSFPCPICHPAGVYAAPGALITGPEVDRLIAMYERGSLSLAEHIQSDTPELVTLEGARDWAKLTSAGWFIAGAVFGAAVFGKAWGVWS